MFPRPLSGSENRVRIQKSRSNHGCGAHWTPGWKPTPISWATLHNQFGRGYGQLAAFKRQFLGKILPAALAVYPEAADRGVEVTDNGLILKPARPPITVRAVA